MTELGQQSKDLHAQLGIDIAEAGVQLLLTVGKLAEIAAETAKKSATDNAIARKIVHIWTRARTFWGIWRIPLGPMAEEGWWGPSRGAAWLRERWCLGGDCQKKKVVPLKLCPGQIVARQQH